MARSNGHNGHGALPGGPAPEPAPHWRHPADPGQGGLPAQPLFQGHPQHGGQHTGQHTGQPGFAPSPDLPPFNAHPVDPYAPPTLAHYAPQGHGHPPQPPQLGWGPPSHEPLTHDPRGQDPRTQDPRLYDLGHYGQGGHAVQPQTHDPYGRPVAPQAAWVAHNVAHGQAQDPTYAPQPSFAEPSGRGGPAMATLAGAGGLRTGDRSGAYAAPVAAPQMPEPEAYEDDGYDDESLEDEPQRGRKLMVVGALVGAICVGGGLAYAYKTFSGGKPPIVAQQKQPAAGSAGGAKVAAKLPEAVPAQAVAAAATPEDGTRRVQTIAVAPPGSASVAPQTLPAPQPPASAAVMAGMVLDNLPRPSASAPQPPQPGAATAPLRPSAPAQVPQPSVAVVPPKAPPAPVAVAAPAPKVAIVNTPPAAAPLPEKKVVAAPPKTRVADAYTPGAAPGATGGVTAAPQPSAKSTLGVGSGANGYVAALFSTQKSRPEAMKSLADLVQKFPDVLGGKPAEIQEKDLGAEKGVWHRAVIGPPGSRQAASEVCVQLKASGYGSCLVYAY